MGWVTGPLLGLDTETTGVDVATDRIVTAAVVRRDATRTQVRTWLIAPDVDIPEQAVAIHGVSTEHARAHGRRPSEALEEIAASLTDGIGAGVPLVAFNASFDLALLDAELARHGLPTLPDRLGREVSPLLDPLVLDRYVDPGRAGPRRLVDLCEHYGVAGSGRLHTADVDVLATLDVLDAMVRRFPYLGAMDAATVHEHGVAARRAWAERATARRAERERAARAAHVRVPQRLRAWVTHLLRSLVTRLPGLRRGRA